MKNMKKTVSITILFLLPVLLLGQTVDRLFIDTRAVFHEETVDGVYSSQFKGEHLNFNMLGKISETVDYRIRQRLNKKVFDENNIFNATDFVYINWKCSDRWHLKVGKDAVLIGGYEYDAVPIDVYYYSRFCENLYQGFTFGVSAGYTFMENQEIAFQVCNSPLSLGIENVYAYNLAWMGQFSSHWKTIWTCNLVEDKDHRMINYIALGNHFVWDSLLIDVDLMNRAGLTQKRFLASDWSVISKIIWSVGKWNICAKGGFEQNDIDNVDADGRPYDAVIVPGTGYVYAGAGLEYFPLGRDNVRFHAVYYRDNDLHRNNFDLGVTWKVDIIRR